MKSKILCLAITLLSSVYISSASASDPCTVTLCLWGKMNGSSSSDCNNPERQFFNIVMKKKGSFRPDKTFDARKSFLNNECPAAYGVSQYIDKILQKYGKVRM